MATLHCARGDIGRWSPDNTKLPFTKLNSNLCVGRTTQSRGETNLIGAFQATERPSPGKDAPGLGVLVEPNKGCSRSTTPGAVAVNMLRGVGVEATAVWGRVTGGDSVCLSAGRISALRQRGGRQRDARRRNSGNQCEFGFVDHDLSPEFHGKQSGDAVLPGDQEMWSLVLILN